jgi:hypothetical protein
MQIGWQDRTSLTMPLVGEEIQSDVSALSRWLTLPPNRCKMRNGWHPALCTLIGTSAQAGGLLPGEIAMDVLIVAADRLLALSLEAAVDLGGHQAIGPAATANVALSLAEADRPAFALIHLGSLGSQGLARKLRDRFDVPSLLVAPAGAHCTPSDRASAWGQVTAPCGSRTYLKAIAIAAGLRGGRSPRGRLPRHIELFHRAERRRAVTPPPNAMAHSARAA